MTSSGHEDGKWRLGKVADDSSSGSCCADAKVAISFQNDGLEGLCIPTTSWSLCCIFRRSALAFRAPVFAPAARS